MTDRQKIQACADVALILLDKLDGQWIRPRLTIVGFDTPMTGKTMPRIPNTTSTEYRSTTISTGATEQITLRLTSCDDLSIAINKLGLVLFHLVEDNRHNQPRQRDNKVQELRECTGASTKSFCWCNIAHGLSNLQPDSSPEERPGSVILFFRAEALSKIVQLFYFVSSAHGCTPVLIEFGIVTILSPTPAAVILNA